MGDTGVKQLGEIMRMCGKGLINYEMRVAVLDGDFFFAPSSCYLVALKNLEDGALKFSSHINLEDKILLKGGGNVMSVDYKIGPCELVQTY
ncbi:uncharacterized protein G2W53_027270 [Senna tora]|uniref:Uncharacterized protein n=1 Tax=Senna tora TaxID=362788 RepID=A0A834TJ16_9FABA|nr:uncharacterized protein G2W53_027270 [Senna tora]